MPDVIGDIVGRLINEAMGIVDDDMEEYQSEAEDDNMEPTGSKRKAEEDADYEAHKRVKSEDTDVATSGVQTVGQIMIKEEVLTPDESVAQFKVCSKCEWHVGDCSHQCRAF